MSYLGGSTLGMERLGGPIRMERARYTPDPTLDACCQREHEENARGSAKRRTLQRFDVVAERERRRRNLVNASNNWTACRCCWDPNSDGGEYRALYELREKQQRQKQVIGEEYLEEGGKKLEADRSDEDSDDEFDYLLDEDAGENSPELTALEKDRRAELEFSLYQKEVAQQHGYGVHRQMHPSRVLRAAGVAPGTRDPPPAVVLHLVDPDAPSSASLDLCLEKIAANDAPGTKFLRSGGRSTLLMDANLAAGVFSSQLRSDTDMPALVAIKEGVVVNVCPRLRGLVSRDGDIEPHAVLMWLKQSGVLRHQVPPLDEVCRIRPEEDALLDNLMQRKKQVDEEEIYDCGVPGCSKTFAHEHVGIQNERQSGHVVAQHQVLGNDIGNET